MLSAFIADGPYHELSSYMSRYGTSDACLVWLHKLMWNELLPQQVVSTMFAATCLLQHYHAIQLLPACMMKHVAK